MSLAHKENLSFMPPNTYSYGFNIAPIFRCSIELHVVKFEKDKPKDGLGKFIEPKGEFAR